MRSRLVGVVARRPASGFLAWLLVIVGFAIGGGIGVWRARTVQMTAMPQLVAMFHSLVGLRRSGSAGALYAPVAFGIAEGDAIHPSSIIEMVLGLAIGAVTFTGSIIAFLKLDGRMSGAPILLPQRQSDQRRSWGCARSPDRAVLRVGQSAAFGVRLVMAVSLALGVLLVLPIGGADMPVVISHAELLTG